MKKKILKEIKPIHASTYIMSEAKKYDSKYERFFMAAVENKILKVVVFKKSDLNKNRKAPAFTIYLDLLKSEWITETSNGDWLTAKIENLRDWYDSGEHWGNRKKDYASEKTKRIINEYLVHGSRNLEPKNAINEYQNRIKSELLANKHRSEIEAIDSVMDVVPELPKDFDSWILDVPLRQKRYLFYKPKEKTAYCTACKKSMKIQKKYSHRTQGKCPTCGKKVMYLSWGMQKSVREHITAGIIQKLTDNTGFIYRRFEMYIRSEKANDYVVTVDDGGYYETDRYRLDNRFESREYFEWGEYKHTGHIRWCHELNHGYIYGYGYSRTTECMLYTRNLKRLLKNTQLKYMPMNELIQSDRYCEPLRAMRMLFENPKIEILFKTGAKNIARKLMNQRPYSKEIILANDKKTPWEVINVTKEQYKEIVKYDMDITCVSIRHILNDNHIKMNPDTLVFFRKTIGVNLIKEIMHIGHFEKMKRYLKEIGADKKSSIAGDYIDYLEDIKRLEKLGELEKNKSILFPKDFQKAHQSISQQRQELENQIEKKKTREKNKILKKMTERFKKMYEVKDSTYAIVFPTTKAQFEKEGRDMHNCVGGYFERVLKGECVVGFIRRKDDIEKSLVTVEFRDDEIRQCRKTCNGDAPKDIWEFAKKATNQYKKEIAKELKNEQKTA